MVQRPDVAVFGGLRATASMRRGNDNVCLSTVRKDEAMLRLLVLFLRSVLRADAVQIWRSCLHVRGQVLVVGLPS